ncbi:MAG: hypothetical protein K0U84_14140 [Actinomycetia bacterium]|nr:hypothetical protein [Actinomycetes bacterium]
MINRAQAERLIQKLGQALANWRYVDDIRGKLPAHLRRQLPASRSVNVRRIVAHLLRMKAIKRSGGDTDGLGIVWYLVGGGLVLVAGAAALAAIAGSAAVISREWRVSNDARQKAALLNRTWSMEQREQQQYGAEAAAQRRQQRVQQAGGLFESTPPDSLPELAIRPKFKVPGWFVPAALVAGALLLFGSQKGYPYLRRRVMG